MSVSSANRFTKPAPRLHPHNVLDRFTLLGYGLAQGTRYVIASFSMREIDAATAECESGSAVPYTAIHDFGHTTN